MCCAGPEGQGSFTTGLIRESIDGERQVSVKELEGVLGLEGLFSEGCGDSVEIPADNVAAGDAESISRSSGDSKEEVTDSDTEGKDSNNAIEESDQALTAEGMAPSVDDQRDTATSEESQLASATVSESPKDTPEDETVDEEEKDTNSSSTLVYLFSTTVSIITLPLRPVYSTVTQLPGQVKHTLTVHEKKKFPTNLSVQWKLMVTMKSN